LDERGGRGPAGAEAIVEALHVGEHRGGAHRVEVAEGAAAEGREAEPEDRADVAVARRAEDPLAPAVQRLVDELQVAALLDLVDSHGRSLRIGHLEPEGGVDALVDRALPLLALLPVEVEAALVLAAL